MNLLRRAVTPPLITYWHAPPLTLRWAGADDAELLEVLAALDEAPIPEAPLMLGFVADELWAAVSVSSGAAICDPFKPSAAVAELAAQRGRQLTVPEPRLHFTPARLRRDPPRLSPRARLGQGAL